MDNKLTDFVHLFQYGCTGISWIAKLFGKELPGHRCCEEHDLAYEQGGSILWKLACDWRLSTCIYRMNGKTLFGFLKASAAFAAVTVFPYSYVVWNTNYDHKTEL